ncbi:MAG: hypothetical protein ABIR26_17590 [Ramlibacter sp.]
MAYLQHASHRTAAQRHFAHAMPEPDAEWPQSALQEFILRMDEHGHCVSRTFMNYDRLYALEQLTHAHTLADERLREVAMALFRHFEQTRSGLAFHS